MGCHCLACKAHRKAYSALPHVKAKMARWRQKRAKHVEAYRKRYRAENAADIAAYQRWYQTQRAVKGKRWRCTACTRLVESRLRCPTCRAPAPWRRPFKETIP